MDIKLKKDEMILWNFTLTHNSKTGEFTVYANGAKSFTTTETDEGPAAMLEYFEKWDSEDVAI